LRQPDVRHHLLRGREGLRRYQQWQLRRSA
jgi:hypothetical protein